MVTSLRNDRIRILLYPLNQVADDLRIRHSEGCKNRLCLLHVDQKLGFFSNRLFRRLHAVSGKEKFSLNYSISFNFLNVVTVKWKQLSLLRMFSDDSRDRCTATGLLIYWVVGLTF